MAEKILKSIKFPGLNDVYKIPEGSGGGTSEAEVFICTISGSASSGYSCDKTVDEINAAYLAGKIVYAKDDTRVMPLVANTSTIVMFCVGLSNGSFVGYTITASRGVTYFANSCMLEKNLVTTISESSTNSNYPSAKAVWDAIPHSFVVDIQIAELGVLDSAPIIDKTFDEIYTAYTNGDYVYALVHCYGMTAHVGIVKISAGSVTFGKCYPDSADTAPFPYAVCVDIMSDDTAEGRFEEEQFLPKATSADNGKVLTVKNGYWDLGNASGGEKAWTKIIDTDVTEATTSFQNDSLNGATEFNIRWSDLQNAGTLMSGLNLVVNGIEIGTYGIAGIVQKSGTNVYGWTHAKYDGLFWHITVSNGATSQNSNAASLLSSVCSLADNVGAADSIKMSAASSEKAPVSGKLEVWAR